MRSTLFAVLAFASAVAVQAESIPGLPSCTSECISADFGGCGTLDVKCICESTTFIAGLACCISVACDAADQNKTIQFADSLCQAYQVTNLPTSATCAAGETPSYVSGAAASSTATNAVTSGTSSDTTTAAAGSGSASTTASSGTTGSAATTGSATSAASAAASSTKTGAANRIEAAALGIGAVVFGGLAAL